MTKPGNWYHELKKLFQLLKEYKMLTNEQVEKQLKETADLIETGVADIKKNMASKKEVLDLIEDRTKTDKEMLNQTGADIKKINTGLTEVGESIKLLQKQIKMSSRLNAAPLFEGGRYKGHFSSPQEAKAFALVVLASVTAGTRLNDRSEKAVKALSDMGIEPYWLDPNGRKVMTGSSQAGGGGLVTVEQIPSIIMLMETYGKFRANAQNMPMGAGQTLQPKIDSLLTVYCPGEGGTATAVDPTIATIALTPKTLVALTKCSMELEDDSMVALGELLAGLFARSFAYYEDLCGFLGDGTSTYFGFKGIVGALRAVSATIASIKSLVIGAGDAYSELTLANFIAVPGILPDFADDGNAKWYEHRYFYYTVFVALALAAGGATASEVIIGAGQKQKLQLGYPVEFTQVMPRAAAVSQICALLANLRQGAYLGTRGGIEFAQSSEIYFAESMIGVRGRDRVAINVHGIGDTTNAGPICGLITAAS
jgi:HK97 family phage major capsid protein